MATEAGGKSHDEGKNIDPATSTKPEENMELKSSEVVEDGDGLIGMDTWHAMDGEDEKDEDDGCNIPAAWNRMGVTSASFKLNLFMLSDRCPSQIFSSCPVVIPVQGAVDRAVKAADMSAVALQSSTEELADASDEDEEVFVPSHPHSSALPLCHPGLRQELTRNLMRQAHARQSRRSRGPSNHITVGPDSTSSVRPGSKRRAKSPPVIYTSCLFEHP